MRRCLETIAVILAVFMTACSPSASDTALLERLELLAVEAPDSAALLVDALPQRAMSHREYRIRAAVAEAEIMYRQSKLLPNDSALNEAIEFYRLRENDPRRQRAYYLRAYQHYLNHRYADAIIDYLNAEHTAALTADTIALGLIYRETGNTFYELDDNMSALEYFGKSKLMFEKARPNKYYPEAVEELGRAYYNAFFYDKALECLLDTVCDDTDNESIKISRIRLIGQCYNSLENYKEAQKYFVILEKEYPHSLSTSDIRYLGHIARHLNDIESTKKYNKLLLERDSTDRWLEYLIAADTGDYEKAHALLEQEYTASNDYFIKVSKSNLSTVLYNFYRLQLQNSLSENKAVKERNRGIIIFSILTLGLITVLFMLYRRRQLREKETNINIISELSETLKIKDNEIDTLEKKSQKKSVFILPPEFNSLEILCNSYYTFNDSNTTQKKAYKHITDIIEKLRAGGKDIKNLIDFINSKMDNIFTRFREENTNMTEAEDRFFLYILLGLSPASISVLQNITVNQVYARKTYIKNKIKKNNGSSSAEILSYF